MKILYFDCFSGISGDMCLGALLDLGIDPETFKHELKKLNLEGYELFIDRKIQKGISGMDVSIVLKEGICKISENMHGHSHETKHDHDHEHSYHEEHVHEHKHEHIHGTSHSHDARNLTDIESLIDGSALSEKVKEFSKKVFSEIAKAEAKVHNKAIDEVHFHEVGAVDSIVDIVGTAICLDMIGAEKIYSSYLHDGCGFIECQHGIIPVPVPAVMEMLAGSGITIAPEEVTTELITPTGMGLIKCLSKDFGKMPVMKIEKTGYGLGKRETGRLNVLRIVQGTLVE